MSLPILPIVLFGLCLLVACACQTVPIFLEEYVLLSANVNEGKEILDTLGEKLQRFTRAQPFLKELREEVIIGAFLPSFVVAWRRSLFVITASAMARWLANNFLARMLSPETFGEKLMLVGLMGLMAYILVSVYVHSGKMATMENINALRAEKKYPSKVKEITD